jgi:UDP-glucose 4-epimerase
MEGHTDKVLVTGGAGFIGSHLVDRLINEDFDVTVIDNLYSGKKENIAHNIGRNNFNFIKGDILDSKIVDKVIKDIDVVFHLAAIVGVPFSIKDPQKVNEVNINGSLTLLKACSNSNVKRFIFASSSAVYGEQKNLPYSESLLASPISPYAITKLATENYCRFFNEMYELKTVILRFFNVYGSRQINSSYNGVICEFIKNLINGKPPVIFDDGKQKRDFVNINDVINAFLLTLKRNNAVGKVFNIAYGEGVEIYRLAQIIIKIFGNTDLKPIYSKSRIGDVRYSYADISLARKILGYKPKISLKDGLKELVNWYQNYHRKGRKKARAVRQSI